jgi:hypothetical protein
LKNEALLCCNSQFFIAKVTKEVFAHFRAVTVKRHSSIQNCLAYQDEVFVNKSLYVTCLAFFDLCEFGLFYLEKCCFVSGKNVHHRRRSDEVPRRR